MLSWSLTRPGFQVARRVAWREVRNADLPASEDPIDSIRRLMADDNLADAVTLITSRDITRHHLAQSTVEGERATWPRMAQVRNQVLISQTLERCLARLEAGQPGADRIPTEHPSKLRLVRNKA